MSERPSPPPEGQLITAALKSARPALSLREAARRVPISEARWRQITSGYQMVNGNPTPVTAPADTIARMAKAVGVSPEQLDSAGRADAAEILRDLEFDEQIGDKTTSELLDEAEDVADAVKRLMISKGYDLESRQKRQIERWAKFLVEDLEDFDQRNNAS